MKKEQVYYLSNPDEMSRRFIIERGHGLFWVKISHLRYRSLATGKEAMLYYSELTPLERDDDDLC